MKYLVVLTIIIGTFISCQRESSQVLDKSHTINLIKKFIPENIYKKSERISFINADKKIKEFRISYNQFKSTDLQNNNVVKDVYTLREQDNSMFYINITAQPELYNNSVYERLYVELLTTLNQGLTASIIIDQNGNTWFNQKEKEITLLGKTFYDVFVGEISKEDIIACKIIYYNSNEGIVGFTDENGDLWVLNKIH
jgi:hypothetical protein